MTSGPDYLRRQRRWHWAEIAFWLLVPAAWFVFPGYLVLGTQVLIAALFALSLDLVMGYAGIVTLGHAAFFGIGAYTAGKLGQQGWTEPVSGLLIAAAAAAFIAALTARLVCRGNDLSRLMITLGLGMLFYEVANKAASITGGLDGMLDIVIAPILEGSNSICGDAPPTFIRRSACFLDFFSRGIWCDNPSAWPCMPCV